MIDTPKDLYDGVILDHSKEPRNFGPLTNPSHYADGRNPICGDEIAVFLQTKGDAFSAFAFSGQGCAISKASASLMTEDLRNRPTEQAKERAIEILQALGQEVNGDPFERYGDLGALTAVRRYPARLKCATLAWHTFLAALAGEATASTEKPK
ncbi:MAG: SUF system NifU family Fe-S cluster assembly protein [Opitutae bacterium]|nr:SUF system NifU family Fe-S cluster assembly protein [Opitutae bacterium]